MHNPPKKGVSLPIPQRWYCAAPVVMIDLENMGADLSINHTSTRDVKSIHQKLAVLYSRRAAVDSLIRCLESYAECQAKHAGRERLKLRSA
jgi:hypothetical protein